MNNFKYLITDCYDRFRFAETREQAEEDAKHSLEHGEDINYIYEIKLVGECYYPEPNPIVDWE